MHSICIIMLHYPWPAQWDCLMHQTRTCCLSCLLPSLGHNAARDALQSAPCQGNRLLCDCVRWMPDAQAAAKDAVGESCMTLS